MPISAPPNIATVLLWLVVIVLVLRVYVAAVRPVLRNRRLARRGFRVSSYAQEQRTSSRGGLFKWVPVLAVIAILAAIAIPQYHDYVGRARDVKRQADLKNIQLALWLYYVRHNAYPVAVTQNTDAAGFSSALAGLVTEKDVPAIPADPQGSIYYYRSNPSGSYFCLGAKLETRPPVSTCDTERLGGALLGANYAIGP
jgi:hypothetical protein